MHKSRLATIVIDCETADVEQAAKFWAQALGWKAKRLGDPSNAHYRQLEAPPNGPTVLVQAVAHPSRVHIDIETDDIPGEVARLENLGAKRIANVKSWIVMEAPTGQRFCVVRPQRSDFEQSAHVWDASPDR
jgi:predicted enzyme related to lactoylglutathione lyase